MSLHIKMRFGSLLLLLLCLSCEDQWRQKSTPGKANKQTSENFNKKNYIDNFSGKVVSHDVVKLAINNSGILEKFKLTPGQFVKKTSLLAKLDTTDLQQEKKVNESEIAEQKITIAYYRKRTAELQSLVKKKYVEKSHLQEAEFQLESAVAKLNRLRKAIEVIDSKISASFLYAPSDGQVLSVNKRQGEFYNPSELLIEFLPTSSKKIELEIPFHLWGKFQAGQTIEYSIESGLEPGHAIVESILPRVNSKDDTFTVVAIMDVTKLDLPLGSSVYVTYRK